MLLCLSVKYRAALQNVKNGKKEQEAPAAQCAALLVWLQQDLPLLPLGLRCTELITAVICQLQFEMRGSPLYLPKFYLFHKRVKLY